MGAARTSKTVEARTGELRYAETPDGGKKSHDTGDRHAHAKKKKKHQIETNSRKQNHNAFEQGVTEMGYRWLLMSELTCNYSDGRKRPETSPWFAPLVGTAEVFLPNSSLDPRLVTR